MSVTELIYTGALRAVRPAAGLLARGDGKLARGIRGRSGVLERMRAWVEGSAPSGAPLVWFHASSAGEGLQARPVIEALRERRPEIRIVYTFFSPSAEAFAGRIPADFADYLPWDLPRELGAAFDLLRPDVLAFSKTDVWPNLTRVAARRGVPMALLSATLPPGSSRLSGPARLLLGPAYRRLARVAAISPEDAERFGGLGVPSSRTTVMGDSHFDRVLARVATVDPSSPLLGPLASSRTTIVAGSTWQPDEERLFEAVAAIRARDRAGSPALIVAPHDPAPDHLRETEARLHATGLLPYRRLAALEGRWDAGEVLIVDRVGILGELYAVADIAYVGGGWGTAGLHSVLEPAAFGRPVVFGPHHANAREAGELVTRGGAFSVSDLAALRARLGELVNDPAAREAAGAEARAYVERGRGAADRGADLIEELLRRAR